MKINTLWALAVVNPSNLFKKRPKTYHIVDTMSLGEVSYGHALCSEIVRSIFFSRPEFFITHPNVCQKCKRTAKDLKWLESVPSTSVP